MSPNKSNKSKTKGEKPGAGKKDTKGKNGKKKVSDGESSEDESMMIGSKYFRRVSEGDKDGNVDDEMEWSVARRKRGVSDGGDGSVASAAKKGKAEMKGKVDESKGKVNGTKGSEVRVNERANGNENEEGALDEALRRMSVINERLDKWVAEKEVEGSIPGVRELLGLKEGYEGIVHGLLRENERLKGKLEGRSDAMIVVRDEIVKLCDSVSKTSETVRCMSERMDEMNERVNEIEREGMAANERREKRVNVNRSYAVIVKGASDNLSTDEVRKRMNATICKDMDVRVRAVRPVRGGGLVVETASSQECKAIAENCRLGEAGLRADRPKGLDPRVVVYDVSKGVSDKELLEGMYEKCLKDVIEMDEFAKRVKIVRKFASQGKECMNVIIEMPSACRARLLKDGRVYVKWMSFKVNVWEKVPRCFKCLSFGHRANECKGEKVCWRCSRAGHNAAACRAPECCGNCKLRKQPSGHSAMSPQCPEYEWRLKLLRMRYSNG